MGYISGEKLKGDIYTYRRYKNRMSSPTQYYDSEKIVERAENILQQYADDKIDVHAKDHKIMAQYIDTFAVVNHEKLLDKLQDTTVFDVRKYLADSKRTYWQRLFNIDQKKPKKISARGMKKRIEQYNKLSKKLAGGWYHKDKVYQQHRLLENEAEHYASNFVADKIQVLRSDVSTLKDYFQTFNSQDNPNDITLALQKINETQIDNYPEKAPSRWQRFTSFCQNKWNGLFSNRNFPRVKSINMSRTNWLKVAAVSALFVIGGTVLLKSDSFGKLAKKDKSELKQKAAEPKQQPNTIDNAFTQETAELKQQHNTIDNAFTQETAELTHEQKIWKNFYDTKNSMLADAAKIDVNNLYEKIKANIDAGVLTMPEGISNERFAYTHIMYKAYSLPSPLEGAINSNQPLTQAQYKAIEEAIKLAGTNGMGVKKLAALQCKRMGRNLKRYSAFDHSSKNQQQKYIANIKAVKQMSQRSV